MNIEESQQELIEMFAEIDEQMDRYAMVIDLGTELPSYPDGLKTPDRLIEGCQSNVWLDATVDTDGNVVYRADSNSSFVKGMIAMLVNVLSGHKPQEILDADLHFINDIGLGEHLSPRRSNGLLSMVKQMRAYAAAYNLK
ncbi:MAG: SufE family protein [Muribaculaceae bacterium]|nr:SufE family protein [Muribaculaceae bacterium]